MNEFRHIFVAIASASLRDPHYEVRNLIRAWKSVLGEVEHLEFMRDNPRVIFRYCSMYGIKVLIAQIPEDVLVELMLRFSDIKTLSEDVLNPIEEK